MPGLIEGAHEGKGLGDRFLRHLDRTKVLVHLVDVSGSSGRDPIEDFETIRRELAFFSGELGEKPQIVAATKMDAVTDPAGLTPSKRTSNRTTCPSCGSPRSLVKASGRCRKRCGDISAMPSRLKRWRKLTAKHD